MYGKRPFLNMYGNEVTPDSFLSKAHSGNDWQKLIEKVRGFLLQTSTEGIGPTDGKDFINPGPDEKVSICVLFSSNATTSRLMQRRKALFRQLLPNVYHLFGIFKSQQHRALTLVLQNIESEIFLNRIAQERLDLPVFTIHDSIVTTVGNETYVEEIMREELEKAIGIRPFLKLEY